MQMKQTKKSIKISSQLKEKFKKLIEKLKITQKDIKLCKITLKTFSMRSRTHSKFQIKRTKK